ncbi:MAG: type IV pilin [Thaumarchaeota archaeon]|nr:type IV pilin [Nitrososphaerota archaeon]
MYYYSKGKLANTIKPKRTRKHRAVAPVIATLLLVAIAVVGGTIIFVFAQGFFSQSQISGTPTIELIKILGYDGRDVSTLQTHDGGPVLLAASGGNADSINQKHERIAIYLKNDSVQKMLISELRFGGTVYTYAKAATLDAQGAASSIPGGTYDVWLSEDGITDLMLLEGAAEFQPGQTATILLALDTDFKSGRDTQFKLTTTNGAVFVGTVVIGQQSG